MTSVIRVVELNTKFQIFSKMENLIFSIQIIFHFVNVLQIRISFGHGVSKLFEPSINENGIYRKCKYLKYHLVYVH